MISVRQNARFSFLAIAAITVLSVGECADAQQDPNGIPSIDGKSAKFVTKSQILIARTSPYSQNATGQQAKEDIVATQLIVLRSQVILEKAVEQLKKTDFKNLDLAALQSRLRVQRDAPDSDIVRMAWYGNDEKEGPAVLAAVFDEYKSFLDDEDYAWQPDETPSTAMVSRFQV